MPRHLILFVGALVAIGPLSLDAYLPAMPAMADAFHVGIVRINNTISVYLVGYGLGQFFGGAFSDQIGRKRVGLIGLVDLHARVARDRFRDARPSRFNGCASFRRSAAASRP